MSSADAALQRAHACLEDAKDPSLDASLRFDALDSARVALLDARRARASPAHLEPVFTTLLTAAAADRSHTARAVVPQAVEDLCLRDLRAFIPPATPFLSRALHDSHVLVAARALRALTTLFRKTIGFVVSAGVGEQPPFFPEAHLSTWLQMQQKAVSLIHVQDEGLRKAAVKFAETVVLAFSYSGGPGSADHFTLDYVMKKGSNSALLNVRTLEEEGIRCVRSIAQLVMTSLEGNVITAKPDSSESVRGLPPASFMTAISVLGNLVRRRRKLIDFTLPPFLGVVPAVIGTVQPPCLAMKSLTEGQRQSIITVLRFNLGALRGYPHVRTGRVGADITQATNALAEFEREQENRRKEEANALAAMERRQKAEAAEAAEAEKRRAAAQAQSSLSLKRPRTVETGAPWPRLPPKEAFTLSQSIIQSMPPQEVVNFIMTRLLLNVPAADTIPGAQKTNQRSGDGLRDAIEEPASKRARKSRFGTKDTRPTPNSTPPVVATKKATVRKTAPPVLPVRLSPQATEKLVVMCSRRIMERVTRATASGAGPLRIQLLARLLSRMARSSGEIAHKFCNEACGFIVNDIVQNMPLAQAWLFSLVCETEMMAAGEASKPVLDTKVEGVPVDQEPHVQNGSREQTAVPSDSNAKAATENVLNSLGTGDDAKKGEKDNGNTMTKTEIKGEPQIDSQGKVKMEEVQDKDGDIKMTNGNVIAVAQVESQGEVGEEELEEDEIEAFVANPEYERILTDLLDRLKDVGSLSSDAFSMLVTEAPMLPPSVISMLRKFCHDPSSIKFGLNTIHDIILKRPGSDRQACLSLLLDLCSDEDEVLRGPAIRLTANKIFTDSRGDVPKSIEQYAIDSLRAAIHSLAEAPTAEDISTLDRKSLLLTALCGQKHELLREVALFYKESPTSARKTLLSRAKDLGAHLGLSALPVLQLIAAEVLPLAPNPTREGSKTDELEDLALEMLQAILKKFGRPTEEIVMAAIKRYELSQEPNFLIAVLAGLPRKALLEHLSAIVNAAYEKAIGSSEGILDGETSPVDDTKRTVAFKEVIGIIMSTQPPPISPAELLIELHNIEPTAAVSSAIRACFELKSFYKQEAIAQAIQQLMEQTTIPDFFMRTVHLARLFYPEREKYLTGTVMKRLIEKHVWKNEVLWEGYLMYCAEVKEKSVKLLLSLPVAQLADALEKQPALRLIFKDLVANPKNAKKIQVKHRKVIEAAIKKAPASS